MLAEASQSVVAVSIHTPVRGRQASCEGAETPIEFQSTPP